MEQYRQARITHRQLQEALDLSFDETEHILKQNGLGQDSDIEEFEADATFEEGQAAMIVVCVDGAKPITWCSCSNTWRLRRTSMSAIRFAVIADMRQRDLHRKQAWSQPFPSPKMTRKRRPEHDHRNRARARATAGANEIAAGAYRAGRGVARFAWYEFFFAEHRNPHTQRAYQSAVRRFPAWAEGEGLELANIPAGKVGQYLTALRCRRRVRELLFYKNICLV